MSDFNLTLTYATLSSDEGPPFGAIGIGICTGTWNELLPTLAGALLKWS